MDCFLSASLGRPNAISPACVTELCPKTSPESSSEEGCNDLVATVNAAKLIGDILNRIYQERKASRSMAYALSFHFSAWMKDLPKRLQWRHISLEPENADLTLKRLHINLIYFHGVILLTRPFLLYQISSHLNEKNNPSAPATRIRDNGGRKGGAKPEDAFCFHGACVRSAVHSITAVHAVFMAEALPQIDPFVVYEPC